MGLLELEIGWKGSGEGVEWERSADRIARFLLALEGRFGRADRARSRKRWVDAFLSVGEGGKWVSRVFEEVRVWIRGVGRGKERVGK